MALSSEGDIIYLTENVTQQLGLPQASNRPTRDSMSWQHRRHLAVDFENCELIVCFVDRQVDLIGQSVYDYCHPCDHDELRDVLGLRADGDVSRSFFLRLKSTLSVKGRSSNLKAASYKVSHPFYKFSYLFHHCRAST